MQAVGGTVERRNLTAGDKADPQVVQPFLTGDWSDRGPRLCEEYLFRERRPLIWEVVLIPKERDAAAPTELSQRERCTSSRLTGPYDR